MDTRLRLQRQENFERGGIIRIKAAGAAIEIFLSTLATRAQEAGLPFTILKDDYAFHTALPEELIWMRNPVAGYEVHFTEIKPHHQTNPVLRVYYNSAGAVAFAMNEDEPLARRLAAVTTYGPSYKMSRQGASGPDWLCWAFRYEQLEALELFRAHFTIFEEFTELLYSILNEETNDDTLNSLNGLDSFVCALQDAFQRDKSAQEGAVDDKNDQTPG